MLTDVITAHTITLGLIEYILDAISLTAEQKMTPEERQQTKESLLGAITLNLTTKLLDQPQIGKKAAVVAEQLKPEMTFDQTLEVLTQNLTPNEKPADINLNEVIIQETQTTLIKFVEKTIPDSEKLVDAIKQMIAKISK